MLACHDVDMIAPVVVSQKWFWGHPRIGFIMGAVLVRTVLTYCQEASVVSHFTFL